MKRRRRPVWQLGGFLGPALLAVLASGVPATCAAAVPGMPPADVGAAAAVVPQAGTESSAAPAYGVPSFAMSPVLAVEVFAPSGFQGNRPTIVSEGGSPFPYEEAALHGAFFQFPVEALESSLQAGSRYLPASCAPVPSP